MKTRLLPITLIMALLSLSVMGAGTGVFLETPQEPTPCDELPVEVYETLLSEGFFDTYDIFVNIIPYIQHGDFNGDGTLDVALQVVNKLSRKRGIVFVHTNDLSNYVIGAGKNFYNLGDNFSWHKQWRKDSQALKKDKAIQSAEALIIDAPDFSKNLIFFDGLHYRLEALNTHEYSVSMPVYGQGISQLVLRISGLIPL